MFYTELSTARLKLRKPILQDAPSVQFLRTDPGVNFFVNRPPAETREKAVTFIEKIRAQIEAQKVHYWSITVGKKNAMVGAISLWNFSENKLTAEVGYDLHPDFQKQGMMSEAIEAVINYGFDLLNLNKIEAFTHHENVNSIKLLTKHGFVLESGRRDDHNKHNRIYSLKKS